MKRITMGTSRVPVLLLAGVAALIALGAMACQLPADVAKQVKTDLTYQDSPNWSGSSWSATSSGTTLYKVVVTASSSTYSGFSVTATTTTLSFNSDSTFTLTATTAYDASNANANYISDNLYYSLSSIYLNPPDLAMGGTAYVDYPQDYYARGAWINGVWYAYSYYSFTPFSYYSIGSTTTTYNGATVYPVTYTPPALSTNINGKTIETDTISGTWALTNATNDPTNTTQEAILTPTSETQVFNDYAGSSTVTTTYNIAPPTIPTATLSPFPTQSPSGKSTFGLLYDGVTLYLD